jgi:Uma2 family endonuclease
MRPMSLTTARDEVLDVALRLPEGATLIVPEIHWDDYEGLLEALDGVRHLHVSYDCGKLEVVSVSPEHDEYGRFFDGLVREFCDPRRMDAEMRGQATWKSRALEKGVEGDSCYYVPNAERIIGKRDINLDVDPPPDIVVEIDISTDSTRKFPIYASLGVPEFWTYDRKTVRIYSLDRGKYSEIAASRFLKGLTGPVLAEAIEISKTLGQRKALAAFRRKIRSLK